MICRHCGKTIIDDAVFCPYCAGKIELTCPHCKAHMENDMLFCPKCGKNPLSNEKNVGKKISLTKKTETTFFYVRHSLLILLGLYMIISIFVPWINISDYLNSLVRTNFSNTLNIKEIFEYIESFLKVNDQSASYEDYSSFGTITAVIIPLALTILSQLVVVTFGISIMVRGIISVFTKKAIPLKTVKTLILIPLGFIIVSGILNGGLYNGGVLIFIVSILVLTFWQIYENILFKGKRVPEIILSSIQHFAAIAFTALLAHQLIFEGYVFNIKIVDRIDDEVYLKGLDILYSTIEELANFLSIHDSLFANNNLILEYNDKLPNIIISVTAFVVIFIGNIFFITVALSELNNFGESHKKKNFIPNIIGAFFFFTAYILLQISFPLYFYGVISSKIGLQWSTGVFLIVVSSVLCVFQIINYKTEQRELKRVANLVID